MAHRSVGHPVGLVAKPAIEAQTSSGWPAFAGHDKLWKMASIESGPKARMPKEIYVEFVMLGNTVKATACWPT